MFKRGKQRTAKKYIKSFADSQTRAWQKKTRDRFAARTVTVETIILKCFTHKLFPYFRRDNRTFRRPNSFSVVTQTDVTINPSFKSHNDYNNEKKNDVVIDKLKTENCDQSLVPTDDCSAPGNVRESLNNFHIPKKNPFARLVDINDHTKVSSFIYSDENSKEDQQKIGNCLKKYHIPKKNPSARRLDVVDPVSIVTNDCSSSQERNKNIELCEDECRKNVEQNQYKIKFTSPNRR